VPANFHRDDGYMLKIKA